MSVARTAILGRIRASLKAKAGDEARIAAANTRIATHANQLVPERARGPEQGRVALFRSFLEGQLASVIEVAGDDAVPAAINTYLQQMELPARLRMGADARLAAMPFAAERGLVVETGPAQADDAVGLSHALCGIAETGTLVMAAGGDNPVTLAFLPTTHIIVVRRDTIVGSYEEAVSKVRDALGATSMPRTLNYISGPSRTADIGGKIVIGAHGPRNLAVIVTG